VSQFKQAVDLAPQWPDARYNLPWPKKLPATTPARWRT
jgi:hypothetical protein